MATKPYRQRIPSLHNGISTQSPSSRFPSQVADAENALFNVVNGVSTRAGTRHHVTLNVDALASSAANFRMHRIIRDYSERYSVVYGRNDNGSMQVLIIDLLNPRNRTQYFTLGSPSAGTFTISFGGQTTGNIPYNASASTIATAIAGLSNVGSGRVTVAASGAWFVVTFSDTIAYDGLLEVNSSLTGATIDGPFGTNCKVTGNSGGVATYLGSGSATADDLRMITIVDTTIIANSKVATGTTTTAYTAIDSTKMPVKMERTTLVPPTFALSTITWNSGTAGPPANTAPKPIQQGKKVADIAYHRGRLCFAMDEWLVASQPDSIYNFFKYVDDTVYNDSDAISVQLGSTSVSVIDYMVPYRKSLLVLTRNGTQFEIGGGDTFTPKTATLTPATAYSTQRVRPAQISSFIYFAGVRENTAVVYEYAYDDVQVANRATAITQHVDGLLPAGIRSLAASDNNDTLIVVPSAIGPDQGSAVASNGLGGGLWSNPNTWAGTVVPSQNHVVTIASGDVVTFDSYVGATSALYLYRTLRIGDKLVQSAWTKYTYQIDRILDVIVIDDTAYVLRNAYRSDKSSGSSASYYRLVVDSMPIAADPAAPATFEEQPRLDRRRVVRGGTYASSNTSWRFDIEDREIDTCVAMVNDEWTEYPVTVAGVAGTADATYTVSGVDLSNKVVVLGRSMPFSFTTSRLFRTDEQGNAIVEGELFVNKVVTDHSRSGPYRIVVSAAGRQDRKYGFAPEDANFDAYGRLSAWTPGRAMDMAITVTNVDSRPAVITGIEFYGTHNTATEG